MTTYETTTNTLDFTEQLIRDAEAVNGSLGVFTDHVRADVLAETPPVQQAVESYLGLLERGGKRTRGVLTMKGFELFGGEDREMIGHAASAVEAFHAYLLVMDDVADVSDLRRGGPTAHIAMGNFLRSGTALGDAYKLGVDAAQAAAMYGAHRAQQTMGELRAPAELRLQALCILNDGLARTSIGQAADILSASVSSLDRAEILKIAMYKTSYYSFDLPLRVGATLAGAPQEDLGPLGEYSTNAGLAFQLRDDVIGLYGTNTGKSRKSDIAEGKKTLLMAEAMEAADGSQRAMLQSSLGNPEVSDAQFDACLDIIRQTGALDRVNQMIEGYTSGAIAALDAVPPNWAAATVQFLRDMAIFSATRQV